ncbi:MAG: hypothetical protein LBE74_01185 [Treponema sp.]|jgi:N-acylneuraminate cytidylyltransferase|nr:hypothetical protein [Treponema sp.]
MNKVTAIVPARGGSARLKDKNIARFADTNLLLFKIDQLKRVSLINRIVVSSDSETMLEMAANAGVETQRRPAEYCDEKTKTFGETVEWVTSNLEGEHILWATCTSPLTDAEDYQKAIAKYFEIAGVYDSLVSFEALKRFVWDEKGPINYVPGQGHVSSQDLPALFVKTCGISIAPRRDMIRWKYDHGANPYRFILDKRAAIDIDDVYDLVCARAWRVLPPPPLSIRYRRGVACRRWIAEQSFRRRALRSFYTTGSACSERKEA